VISVSAADRIRAQVADAVKKGAQCLVDADLFPMAVEGSKFVAPQILINCNHTMEV
jgi:acyl-CoA reductase-like NAD-dependent aldehyde dehydrogenase